ncbi:2645_t:CDS:2 [Funneliformis geosporum]|nr:2645_t:CDS:2 [Funneliformis geosporum]
MSKKLKKSSSLIKSSSPSIPYNTLTITVSSRWKNIVFPELYGILKPGGYVNTTDSSLEETHHLRVLKKSCRRFDRNMIAEVRNYLISVGHLSVKPPI